MAKFRVYALGPGGVQRTFIYDNMVSTFVDEATGKSIVPIKARGDFPVVLTTSKNTPNGKKSPRILKISLGLSCNYECDYCSQRFVPRAAETNPRNVEDFMEGLDSWVKEPPERIELWGGEPLVYIKTLRPLAEALRAKYPHTDFGIITNGSLLTKEINEWLDRLGFTVGLSHDGPGQHVRGPDPLEDPKKREAILDLWNRLGPKQRMSFNSILNKDNTSRAAIQDFFVKLTGDPKVPIGEGVLLDTYDAGALQVAPDMGELVEYRQRAFAEVRKGLASNFNLVREKIQRFINGLITQEPATAIGMKCGMDNPSVVAVDLKGNVLTCQNTSVEGVAPNGESHKIGHVSDMAGVKLTTSTHWSHRESCPNCPMLHLCRGSCMFLEGPLFHASCNNSFSDSVVYFAAAVEFLTGCIPVRIEGPNHPSRHSIWEKPAVPPKQKVIPIKAV